MTVKTVTLEKRDIRAIEISVLPTADHAVAHEGHVHAQPAPVQIPADVRAMLDDVLAEQHAEEQRAAQERARHERQQKQQDMRALFAMD